MHQEGGKREATRLVIVGGRAGNYPRCLLSGRILARNYLWRVGFCCGKTQSYRGLTGKHHEKTWRRNCFSQASVKRSGVKVNRKPERLIHHRRNSLEYWLIFNATQEPYH
jgi:hypothetical protein